MSLRKSIGECSICLSLLTFTNIYAISKCGHTFHQKCLNEWLPTAKSCPLCRINASEADVIKLFIQESTEIDPKLPEEPYIESKHEGYLRRKMNICNCEFYQYDIGDLWYKCLKEYDVQIKYEEKKRETTVTLPNGYSLTISTSLKTELLHKKENAKTTINPDGQITLRVESSDLKNYLKIVICPKHQIFKVEHFMGKKTIKCPIAEMKCQHLKK
uniref:RING-type domain-containing protein n=1 Tax=Panagrolaimus sp. PS1159 TaxID=55785 RepID=A0AC35FQG1_9BILA